MLISSSLLSLRLHGNILIYLQVILKPAGVRLRSGLVCPGFTDPGFTDVTHEDVLQRLQMVSLCCASSPRYQASPAAERSWCCLLGSKWPPLPLCSECPHRWSGRDEDKERSSFIFIKQRFTAVKLSLSLWQLVRQTETFEDVSLDFWWQDQLDWDQVWTKTETRPRLLRISVWSLISLSLLLCFLHCFWTLRGLGRQSLSQKVWLTSRAGKSTS